MEPNKTEIRRAVETLDKIPVVYGEKDDLPQTKRTNFVAARDGLANAFAAYRCELLPSTANKTAVVENIVMRIVKAIELSLNDRRGLHIDDFDAEIRRDIRTEWCSLLNPIVAGALTTSAGSDVETADADEMTAEIERLVCEMKPADRWAFIRYKIANALRAARGDVVAAAREVGKKRREWTVASNARDKISRHDHPEDYVIAVRISSDAVGEFGDALDTLAALVGKEVMDAG